MARTKTNHQHDHDAQHDAQHDAKYTDPALRRRLHDEIMRGTRGGKAGQWSARKSQLLVREYEAHGGGYTSEKRDDAARSLQEWSREDWQTVSGSGDARHGKKVERYLPKAVWNMLSVHERQEAVRTKDEASARGVQHVEWPESVREAIHEYERHKSRRGRGANAKGAGAARGPDGPTRQELYARAREQGVRGRSTMTKAQLERAVSGK